MRILFVNEAAGEEQELAPIFPSPLLPLLTDVKEDICVCNKRNKWSWMKETLSLYMYYLSFYHHDHHVVENLWFINRLMLAF